MINVVRSHARARGLHGRYLELEYVEGKGLRAYTGSGARNRFPFCPFSPRAGLLRLLSISPSLLPPCLSYSLSSFSTRIKKRIHFWISNFGKSGCCCCCWAFGWTRSLRFLHFWIVRWYIYINIFFSGLFFCDRLLESATVVMSGLLCFLEGFF